MGIKIYNGLPPEIKDLSPNIKKFKSSLRGFHHRHSFYALEESFNYNVTVRYTGRFIMFSVITNISNKKTKGPTLMELFTATGKLKKFFFFFCN